MWDAKLSALQCQKNSRWSFHNLNVIWAFSSSFAKVQKHGHTHTHPKNQNLPLAKPSSLKQRCLPTSNASICIILGWAMTEQKHRTVLQNNNYLYSIGTTNGVQVDPLHLTEERKKKVGGGGKKEVFCLLRMDSAPHGANMLSRNM